MAWIAGVAICAMLHTLVFDLPLRAICGLLVRVEECVQRVEQRLGHA